MEFAFGVLPYRATAMTESWSLALVEDFDATLQRWVARGPDTNWVYPPLIGNLRAADNHGAGVPAHTAIPGSERSAVIWGAPVTHRLSYHGNGALDEEEAKRGIATFLIYLLGTLYGVELQHRDWFVAGRQRKQIGGLFLPVENALEQLLAHAERWFYAQQAPVRTAAISALYLHNHVPSYEFSWEQFAWQYSVFDACWFIATESGAVPPPTRRSVPHRDRLGHFARACGLVVETGEFGRWVDFRNDLIHQVTWGEAVPGHRPVRGVYDAYFRLRNFATMALFGAIGFRSPSLRQPWWARDRLAFSPIA